MIEFRRGNKKYHPFSIWCSNKKLLKSILSFWINNAFGTAEIIQDIDLLSIRIYYWKSIIQISICKTYDQSIYIHKLDYILNVYFNSMFTKIRRRCPYPRWNFTQKQVITEKMWLAEQKIQIFVEVQSKIRLLLMFTVSVFLNILLDWSLEVSNFNWSYLVYRIWTKDTLLSLAKVLHLYLSGIWMFRCFSSAQ